MPGLTTFSRKDIPRIAPPWQRASHEPLKILYVGRIALEKGLGGLIEALGLLAASPARGAHLTLIGRRLTNGDIERSAFVTDVHVKP